MKNDGGGINMTLEQLEYVLAVESKGTISAAAQALNISHPAISRSISNLEEELGINIFARSRSGMEITPEGKLVLESAQIIRTEIDRLYEKVGQRPEHQLISVAVFPVDSLSFLPDVISSFRENCDYGRVSVRHMEISEAIVKVRTQQVTFGICALARSTLAAVKEEFAVVPLIESSYVIGYSPSLLQTDRGFITPEEVRRYPLILHDDTAIVSALTEILGDLSSLNVLMYSNDNALIKKMVAEGHALSIHSRLLGENDPAVASGGIQLIPLKNESMDKDQEEAMKVSLVLFYNKKKLLNQAERIFVKALKKRTEGWGNENK